MRRLGIIVLFLVALGSAISTANLLFSQSVPGGGNVQIIPGPPINIGTVNAVATAVQFVAAPSGTGSFAVDVRNTVGAIIQSPIIIASMPPVNVAATAVQAIVASATVPVSFPAVTQYVTGVPAPLGTVWIANSPGVNPQNTVYVTGVPAGVATNWIANSPGVNVQNSPAVVPWDIVAGPTSLATTGAGANLLSFNVGGAATVLVNTTGTYTGTLTFKGTIAGQASLAVSGYPYDRTTGLINGAPATTVACAGTCSNNFIIPSSGYDTIIVQMTAFTSGSVSVAMNAGVGSGYNVILGTPAIQGSVSINNTPAVQGSVSINNTPAVQGSVSILNTPAVQGSVSINNYPTMAVMVWPSPANPLQTQPVSLPASLPTMQVATADPCMNPGIAKSFATIGLATATLGINQYQRIVTGSGALKVYVCGCSWGMQATAAAPFPQFQFVQSTPTATTGGVQCVAAGGVNLSGLFTGSGAAAANGQVGQGGAQVMSVAAGNSLCILATPNANLNVGGVCSYIQQ